MRSKTIGILSISLLLGACATKAPETQNGPIVLNVRANPETVNLDRNFKPTSPAEVLAEVKDYKAEVTEVRMNVRNTPISIPMQHVSGTTWRATLTPAQLKTLGIGDQTTQYDVDVIAKDSMGLSKVERSTASIQVKGPDLQKQM